MRFVTIVGARPQFIKAAPLGEELRHRHDVVLVHTGQHYDENMSEVFFRELGIPAPDRNLGVGSGPQGAQTGAMMERIEQCLAEVRPDAMIVFGDTNSTMAGALAAVKMGVPVAHVEAGLRSFNRSMPEEINRVVTDHVSTWLLVPSQNSARQLASEGIMRGVHEVGDIMADTVRKFAPRAARQSAVLERMGLRPGGYGAATVHRAANTDDAARLAGILEGLGAVGMTVVLPLHPRTREAIRRHGLQAVLDRQSGRVRITEPLGYLDMLQLQQNAAVVLTDSGGIQKEAYYLGVPCVTMRDETEWTETVVSGWNRLAGTDPAAICAAVNEVSCRRGTPRPDLYGDGHAARRIVEILES